MSLEDRDSLLDLGIQSLVVLQKVQQLAVVHLEQHASDLAGVVGLTGSNLGVQVLTNHLLLLIGIGSGQSGSGQASGLGSRGSGSGSSGTVSTGLALVLGETTTAGTGDAAGSSGTLGAGGTLGTTLLTGGTAALRLGAGTLAAGTALAHRGEALAHRVAGHGSTGVHLLGLVRVNPAGAGDHTGLAGVDHTATTLGREATGTGVEELGRVHAAGHLAGHLLHAELGALGHLGLQLRLADLLALGKSDVDGLGAEHAAVHLGDSLGGLIGGREADETETLGGTLDLLSLLSSLLIAHDLGGGDDTINGELLTELLIIDIVIQVLDVQVDALVLVELLHLLLLVLLLELLLTLTLLLGAGDEQLLLLVLGIVELIDGALGILVVFEVDETEALGATVLIGGDDAGSDGAKLGEESLDLLLGDLGIQVLDVDVGEVGLHLLDLGLTLLLGNVVSDVNLLVVQQHSVDVLDGVLSSLVGLVVNETVSLGLTILGGDLAGQDVAEGGEGVVKSLVVDGGIQVLDEDVAGSGLAEGGVALGPHDAAGTVLDQGVVQGLQGTLTYQKQGKKTQAVVRICASW